VADGPGWRLGFREIVDRTAAERLRDAYLETEIDRTDLAEGEAFWHEVIGAPVVGTDGRELGRVVEIYRAGQTEVYVVRGGPVGEFDMPAVRTVITSFDPRGAGIAVDEAALDLASEPVDPKPARDRKARRWSRHGKGASSGGEADPGEADNGEAEGGEA
jgi:ribosomal 30S subunit maturation factor RimM